MSKAAPPSTLDPIETAVSLLASELPALVATAVLRAKKGKPATLLRSVHRMVKELDTMIGARTKTKPQEWERLRAFGPITGPEARILGNLLELVRGAAPPAEDQSDGGGNPPSAELREAMERQHAAENLTEKRPASAPAPYTGPERRFRSMQVFIGKQERRRQPHR